MYEKDNSYMKLHLPSSSDIEDIDPLCFTQQAQHKNTANTSFLFTCYDVSWRFSKLLFH